MKLLQIFNVYFLLFFYLVFLLSLRAQVSSADSRRSWNANQNLENPNCYHGCGVGVVGNRRILDGVRVGFLSTLRVGFFVRLQLRKSSWIIFTSHCYVTNSCENVTISYESFVETGNSCCVPWFPLSVSCCRIVWQPNFIHIMLSSRSRKFWKGRSWSRILTFYLWLRNHACYQHFQALCK